MMGTKRGAGVIPCAWHEHRLQFLLHKTFKGRRAGLLVDFGGGSDEGESLERTAAREFVEETEAMFLTDQPGLARLELHAEAQIGRTLELILATQAEHPDWWCPRIGARDRPPREWKSFFVQMDYQPLEPMNRLWEENPQGRFKKRRKLLWIDSRSLIELFERHPARLWTRVRELQGLVEVIQRMECHYQGSMP